MKHANWVNTLFPDVSHPAWVCGLKLNVGKILNGKNVTPCVGVWIETFSRSNYNRR